MFFSRYKNLIIISLAAGVLIAAGFFLYQHFKHPAAEVTASAPDAIALPVVKVIKKTLFRQDQLPAEIKAYQDVMIYPKIPGFIEWIGVDRGSVVKHGQLMVRMYAPEYIAKRNEYLSRLSAARAAAAEAESRLQDVKAELSKRQANLLADESTYQRVYAASLVPGVIAINDVVQWRQAVETDKQDVNALIKRVNASAHEVDVLKDTVAATQKSYVNFADFASYLNISAPFNGYITERKMHVGSFVGPLGSGAYPPICRIQQLDLLRIVTPVPERDTAAVVLGSAVEFSVSSFPDRRFVGEVARISNCLDRETRTMPVELNFLNPDYEILPGMFCQVYWPTRRHETSLFVPDSAVISTPLTTFVCKVNKDNIVEWVNVKKGQIMMGMVEVFGDLHEGDLVARQASEELQNESRVRPLPVKASLKEDDDS